MDRRKFLQLLGITTGVIMASTIIGYYSLREIYKLVVPTSTTNTISYGDQRDPSSFINRLFIPTQISINNIELKARVANDYGLALNYAYYYNNHLNPIIRVRKGDDITVRFINELPQRSIIHWHGLYLPWDQDGHPLYEVKSGESYNYSFKIYNRSGTYWYHPHPMGITSFQAYMGLASLFLIEDENEDKFMSEYGISKNEEIPLIIQDKRVNEYGKIVYEPTQMDWMMGFLGDKITVNFTPNPYIELDTRIYRFRVLNASNARKYKLSLITSNGKKVPYYLIGNDGGFLEKPIKVYETYIDSAERIDILVDLRGFNKGDILFLKSESFDPMNMMKSMMGRMNMMGTYTTQLEDGEEFYILKIIIKEKVSSSDQKLISENDFISNIEPIDIKGAKSRKLILGFSMMPMRWTINGLTYDLSSIPIKVERESVEIWELTSEGMPHSFHIHGGLFQVLERLNSPPQVRELAIDEKGRLPADLGWKDTITVWPNEIVKIAISFSKELSGTSSAPYMFSGRQLYLLHCHNLEHEDSGMMLNYGIE